MVVMNGGCSVTSWVVRVIAFFSVVVVGEQILGVVSGGDDYSWQHTERLAQIYVCLA